MPASVILGEVASEKLSPAGWMLRQWRAVRGLSQLGLACEADVSTRHLSFVETGRSEPSRELLLKLAAALGMPPRDRNALLAAAGYQPIYRETALGAPEMAEVRKVLALVLRQHEPFAATAFDRDFNVVMCNQAFARFLGLLAPGSELPPAFEVVRSPRTNLLDLTLDPALGLRGHIRNWSEVARAVLARTRAALAMTRDAHQRAVLDRVLAYPGVRDLAGATDAMAAGGLVIPLEVELGPHTARLLTTISTLGTPQDLTLRELAIEAFHPADPATEALIRALAAA
jgi:transcriptional regulator with XRE-family HTH domain